MGLSEKTKYQFSDFLQGQLDGTSERPTAAQFSMPIMAEEYGRTVKEIADKYLQQIPERGHIWFGKPTVRKENVMDFAHAMTGVLNNEKYRRRSWALNDYITLGDVSLLTGGEDTDEEVSVQVVVDVAGDIWTPTPADMLATDWCAWSARVTVDVNKVCE